MACLVNGESVDDHARARDLSPDQVRQLLDQALAAMSEASGPPPGDQP